MLLPMLGKPTRETEIREWNSLLTPARWRRTCALPELGLMTTPGTTP